MRKLGEGITEKVGKFVRPLALVAMGVLASCGDDFSEEATREK